MKNIPPYSGPKNKCSWCNKSFNKGERVIVDEKLRVVFCDFRALPDACVVWWANVHKKSIDAYTRIFRGQEEQLPEYGGLKSQCDGCGKKFRYREVIWCDMTGQLIFCYNFTIQCINAWKDVPETVVIPVKTRFHGNT